MEREIALGDRRIVHVQLSLVSGQALGRSARATFNPVARFIRTPQALKLKEPKVLE